MKKILYLVLVVFIVFSCKKTDTNTDSSGSQLWIKVDAAVPDFDLTFKCGDVKSGGNVYAVSYADKTFNPNLKTVIVTEDDINDRWILVYTDFGQTDEITLQLASGKIYKAKGFRLHEKRLMEIISSGTINIVDRDISIIERLIYVN